MSLSFLRTVHLQFRILALMLLLYVGQSVAAVSVPCHLLTQDTETRVVHDEMTAENHHHGHGGEHSRAGSLTQTDSISQAASISQIDSLPHAEDYQADKSATGLHDCCDAMNHCLSGNCSLTSVDKSSHHLLLYRNEVTLDASSDEIPARFPDSPYRPPIL